MVIKGGKLYTFDLYIQPDRSSLLLLQINVYIFFYVICMVFVEFLLSQRVLLTLMF